LENSGLVYFSPILPAGNRFLVLYNPFFFRPKSLAQLAVSVGRVTLGVRRLGRRFPCSFCRAAPFFCNGSIGIPIFSPILTLSCCDNAMIFHGNEPCLLRPFIIYPPPPSCLLVVANLFHLESMITTSLSVCQYSKLAALGISGLLSSFLSKRCPKPVPVNGPSPSHLSPPQIGSEQSTANADLRTFPFPNSQRVINAPR